MARVKQTAYAPPRPRPRPQLLDFFLIHVCDDERGWGALIDSSFMEAMRLVLGEGNSWLVLIEKPVEGLTEAQQGVMDAMIAYLRSPLSRVRPGDTIRVSSGGSIQVRLTKESACNMTSNIQVLTDDACARITALINAAASGA